MNTSDMRLWFSLSIWFTTDKAKSSLYTYTYKQRILGECLLISSLTDKALRMPVELRGLQSDSPCILNAEPGKFDIKRHSPGNSIYQFTHWFTLQTSDYGVTIDFCGFSVIGDVIQKVQRHHDWIDTCMR